MAGARALWAPFLSLLLLTYLQEPGYLFALIFGVTFYFIFLVKDLLLIDRRSAYEMLVLTLSFLLLRDFYRGFTDGITGASIFYSFLLAALLSILTASFVNSLRDDAAFKIKLRRPAIWLSFLIFFQAIIVCLFVPLDFVYQAVAVFLIVIAIVDTVPEYLVAALTRSKVLTTATVVFAVLVIVLSSARWGF